MRVSAPSLQRVLPFELVEEVVRELRSPKNSQLRPLASRGAALLHEGAERRDAGAGADHDDVACPAPAGGNAGSA